MMPSPFSICGPKCNGCIVQTICNVPTSRFFQKPLIRKLNEIMKDFDPWSVGVSTKNTASSYFYPVKYNKGLDIWLGIYDYKGPGWSHLKSAYRQGSARGYIIKSIRGSQPWTDDADLLDFLTMADGFCDILEVKEALRKYPNE